MVLKMHYKGVLKTEYVENKIKPLPEKLKKIHKLLVGLIIGMVLAVVAVAVFFGLLNWLLKEVFGWVI